MVCGSQVSTEQCTVEHEVGRVLAKIAERHDLETGLARPFLDRTARVGSVSDREYVLLFAALGL